MISIALVLVLIFVYLHLDRFVQFSIISIATFLPLTFGNLGGIEDFLAIRWLIPVFMLIMLNDVFFLRGKNTESSLNFRGTEIFILALLILFTWALISYIKYPVQADYKKGAASASGGISMYYAIFTNIMLFFAVMLYLYNNIDNFKISKWLKILINTAIVIGFFRVLSFFFDFEMPLMAGAFGYETHGGTAFRIGGLTEVVWLGITALTAQAYITKKINYLAYMLFIPLLILSGGRTIFVGIGAALIIYSILFNPKYFVSLIVSLIFVLLLFGAFAPRELENQYERLVRFEGGIKFQDKTRYEVYVRSMQNFYENPIFGKGISPYSEFIYNVKNITSEHIRAQLFSGGHGSYISLLSTFGIGGILYFAIMVFGGIILSFGQLRHYLVREMDIAAISVFSFIYLIITSIYSITSNNGFMDPTLFFTVGLIAFVRISENR